ncbi:GDSL-like protein [Mobiluncus mulieris 28-1]|uniref:SGNH/GDSL hydrolase family protein n=1 Tax=Mobiluncus mulieris TaxID=2052 RepID=UPI00019F9273|nr:SGNH/GDSL hydrolase family protein [Mobiluncus mulieris]EEJ54184.1 GDSL-like protein [Mobiluncus mulieris ATCC 35243]EEZ91149.1 GDSL-like protein [Mobiluncus mulieris 28-1]EFN93083.1 GDSL-like protein [Mobiluncus mulieris FB024-16]MCV0001767.1 SGNH/GDSL hydrolase family protein [Mobiluncus mulieris]SPX75858.1 GDSL-like Lipase/Acylhydrolase [Mobiluncus mulieris]
MELNKNTLEKVLELIKELPTSSKVSALAALGTSGTLIAAGHTAAGMWKVYQEVSAHRWFWEDHVITGLAKLRELGMWENPAGMNPAFDMLSVGALRHQKRSGWYSNKPLMNPNLTLARPAKIEGAPPFIYVALGDSAAQGVGCEDVRDSYVALLASYLRRATRRRVIVLNLSISGAISSTVTGTELPRLLTLGVKPDLITLDIGGNDTFADDAEIPAELFEKNLEIICRYLPVPTLIAEVPAVTPLPRDRRAVELNEALKAAVEGSPHIVVPIRKLGEVPLWRILSIRAEDGFHPNVDGYRGAALEFARASETLLKERDLWQDTADDLYS